MTTTQIVSIIAMLGWLVLVVSALAYHRLGSRQIVKFSLIWLGVFVGGFVIVSWLM